MKNHYQLPCNIAQTLNILGDKWTLLILRQIMSGHATYKEIQEHLEGIPSNLLANRLKTLEQDALILCKLYQLHPPRYHYMLTDSGRDLGDVFNSLILWGQKHLKECPRELIHTSCEHPVELQYYCPHCDAVVNKSEITSTAPAQS